MVFSNKNIIKKAMDASEEFASYIHSEDIDMDSFRVEIDTEMMPFEMMGVLVDAWESYFTEKYPKVDLDAEDRKDHIGWDDDREYSRMLAFKKEYIHTKKLKKNKAQSLPSLATKLKHIFSENLGERCWIYKLDDIEGHNVPKVVREVRYKPKVSADDFAYVQIELAHNSKNSTSFGTIQIGTDDFRDNDKDPIRILRAKGYVFETDTLYSKYMEEYREYQEKSQWQNLQIIDNRGVKYINDNVYQKKNRDDSSRAYRRTVSEKTVISTSFSRELVEVPYDMTICAFNLGSHSFDWIYAYDIELYKYNPDIEKNLILPEEHKDLIDILLSEEIKELGSDIIAGKGAGTIILAKGRAGIGKTATSEIYSEKKELPLYSVHSGQLSNDGSKMEEKLKVIFGRAERWGCILLLDEADVFIRERDNDVNHNSIVASFLRTMEYYSGTMFMTTNREDDVDEAIESRCIAVLKYAMPQGEMSRRLWELFIGQYKIDTTKEVISELVEKMVDLSGRDIRNISMLTSRYMQGKGIETATFDTFRTCATFRGKYKVG